MPALLRNPLFRALIVAIVFIGAAALLWQWLLRADVPATGPVADVSALVRPHAMREGKASAPVVIVEFFDPACGTCRTFYPVVQQLLAQYPNDVQLVLRYAPFHQGSDRVVALLEAARKQGKFFPALEALFEGQDDWASNHTAKLELALPYLARAGLNMEQLAFDVTAPEVQQVLQADLRDANTLGVTQTPEYFVNGHPLPEFGVEPLRQLVAQAVQQARR